MRQSTINIVNAAMQRAEELKQKGWTKADHAEALQMMFNSDNPDDANIERTIQAKVDARNSKSA